MITILSLIVFVIFVISIVISGGSSPSPPVAPPVAPPQDVPYREVISPWHNVTTFTIASGESVYMDLTDRVLESGQHIVFADTDPAIEAIVLSSQWIETNSSIATKAAAIVTKIETSIYNFERVSPQGGLLFTNTTDHPIDFTVIQD